MYRFSERLTDVRVEAGYSQKDLAKELNITTSAYGYYEQGRNEPSLETVRLLAKKLDVSTDYLLGIIDEPKHPVKYEITDGFILTDAELFTVKQMKEKQLLSELSKNPIENVDRLVRFWQFMNKETQK
ncbi:helix-turn-helix domain-containing protein [Cerasibacillus sp. JNUCC 74]